MATVYIRYRVRTKTTYFNLSIANEIDERSRVSGYHKRNPETFSVNKLKRVDRPTTIIEDDKVRRVSQRDSGFNKAARGLYGPAFISGPFGDPLSGAESRMLQMMRRLPEGMIAASKSADSGGSPSIITTHQGNRLFPAG